MSWFSQADLDDWGHGWSDPEDYLTQEDRERLALAERERQTRELRMAEENLKRRYPPFCGYCGSAFQEEATYGDDDYECVGMPYVYHQGRYECGIEIDSNALTWAHQATEDTPQRKRTFEERVKGGQPIACRTIMELRWKQDPQALERDRHDTRSLAEVSPITAEQLTRHLRVEQQHNDWRVFLGALQDGEKWKDATGRTWAIIDMGEDHRRNLLGFLERKADAVWRARTQLFYESGPAPLADGAYLGWLAEERDIREHGEDPLAWMKKRPLYEAIKWTLRDSVPVDRRAAGYKTVLSDTPPKPPKGYR